MLDQTFDDFELWSSTMDQLTARRCGGGLQRSACDTSTGRRAGCRPLATLASTPAVRIIAFLDDDDRVVPDWLEQFASVINGDQCVVVSCGGLVDEQDTC